MCCGCLMRTLYRPTWLTWAPSCGRDGGRRRRTVRPFRTFISQSQAPSVSLSHRSCPQSLHVALGLICRRLHHCLPPPQSCHRAPSRQQRHWLQQDFRARCTSIIATMEYKFGGKYLLEEEIANGGCGASICFERVIS
jgi:hypothetical protein